MEIFFKIKKIGLLLSENSDYNENPLVYYDDKQNSFHSWSYFLPISWPPSAYDESSAYAFPEPSNININMMPFIVSHTLESCR